MLADSDKIAKALKGTSQQIPRAAPIAAEEPDEPYEPPSEAVELANLLDQTWRRLGGRKLQINPKKS